jgi:hypothetical protein
LGRGPESAAISLSYRAIFFVAPRAGAAVAAFGRISISQPFSSANRPQLLGKQTQCRAVEAIRAHRRSTGLLMTAGRRDEASSHSSYLRYGNRP